MGSNPTLSATFHAGQVQIHTDLQPCRSTQVAIRGSPAKGVVGLNRARVRIPPSAPRRSKVRFAPTSFYACGKKDVIRPLPCSSFPTATRCAGLAVGGPPCGRLLYARKRHIACDELFHFTAKLIARSLKLLLASKPTPLRWASVWVRRCAAVFLIAKKY